MPNHVDKKQARQMKTLRSLGKVLSHPASPEVFKLLLGRRHGEAFEMKFNALADGMAQQQVVLVV